MSGTASATGAGTVNLTANGGSSDINVNADVTSGSGLITLLAGHNIVVNAGNINTSGNVTLTTSGTVNESGAGIITGALLTTSSVGGTLLTNSNDVTSFNATNTTSGNIQLTDTATPVTLTGITETGGGNIVIIDNHTGITVAPGAIVSADTNGNIIMDAGDASLILNAGSLLLSTGIINLTADNFSFNASAQVGGSALNTGLAATVILQQSTAGTSIGVAGGSGSLQLTQATLNTVRATNVRIGNSASGNINIGAFTTSATFGTNGVLTFDTAGTITQTSAIDLSSSNTGLILRDAASVTLTSNNVFGNIAASVNGPISITNAADSTLTVTSLTDDLGTVNGITTTGSSAVALVNAGTGNILVNSTITSGSGVVSLTAGANVTLNAGSISTTGNVNLTGTNGVVSEAGAGTISGATLTTSSVGGTSLGNANAVSTFNATNTSGGAISLINTAAPLTITGISQSGTGNVSVNNTGAISITGTIAAGGSNNISMDVYRCDQ